MAVNKGWTHYQTFSENLKCELSMKQQNLLDLQANFADVMRKY